MVEILVWDDIAKEFARLGIQPLKTYQSTGRRGDISVWELTDEDFRILDNDPAGDEHWVDAEGGWRWAAGSTLGTPEYYPIVRRHRLLGWPSRYWEHHGEIRVGGPYDDLLEYLCDCLGVSTEKNVAAATVDLAKHNNLTLAQLWAKYQG